jgi:hypothetical protein
VVLSDFLRAIVRRWYVVLAGLCVTAALAFGASVVNPPEYSVRGLVLLLPSAETVGVGGNPFLSLSGLDLPARLIVASFQSEAMQSEISEVSPTAEFGVDIEESTRGPVIAIDVTDDSEEGALATLSFIAAEIPENLDRLQDEVEAPPQSRVGSMPLTIDEEAVPETSGTMRLVLAAIGVGIVATLIVTFAVDRLLLGSGRRRSGGGVETDRDEITIETGHGHTLDIPGGSTPHDSRPSGAVPARQHR